MGRRGGCGIVNFHTWVGNQQTGITSTEVLPKKGSQSPISDSKVFLPWKTSLDVCLKVSRACFQKVSRGLWEIETLLLREQQNLHMLLDPGI